MMMHHNTKFGDKIFGGLENIIWINIDFMMLQCDLDLSITYFFIRYTGL